MLKDKFRLVEVYGSLLNQKQRQEMLGGKNTSKEEGTMKEIGKVKREGWKLSFDRYSEKKEQAVLNLVYTGNPKDMFYTTVYEVDLIAYEKVLNREMGEQTAKRWKHGRLSDANSYRPIQLDSQFGITNIFIVPFHGRQRAQTHSKADYVKTVRKGIEESYKYMPTQKEVNLEALKRAVDESKTI